MATPTRTIATDALVSSAAAVFVDPAVGETIALTKKILPPFG